jgi:hypothetical protein
VSLYGLAGFQIYQEGEEDGFGNAGAGEPAHKFRAWVGIELIDMNLAFQ